MTIAELRLPVALTPADTGFGISLRNWRRSTLFDVRLERLVMNGEAILDLELDRPMGGLYPVESDNEGGKKGESIFLAEHLANRAITPGTVVTFFPKDRSDTLADYAAIRFTDDQGRRWEVDSASTLARRVH